MGLATQTIDYIFHTNNFKCTRVLDMPTEAIESIAMPGWKYPSDHFCIVADLVLKGEADDEKVEPNKLALKVQPQKHDKGPTLKKLEEALWHFYSRQFPRTLNQKNEQPPTTAPMYLEKFNKIYSRAEDLFKDNTIQTIMNSEQVTPDNYVAKCRLKERARCIRKLETHIPKYSDPTELNDIVADTIVTKDLADHTNCIAQLLEPFQKTQVVIGKVERGGKPVRYEVRVDRIKHVFCHEMLNRCVFPPNLEGTDGTVNRCYYDDKVIYSITYDGINGPAIKYERKIIMDDLIDEKSYAIYLKTRSQPLAMPNPDAQKLESLLATKNAEISEIKRQQETQGQENAKAQQAIVKLKAELTAVKRQKQQMVQSKPKAPRASPRSASGPLSDGGRRSSHSRKQRKGKLQYQTEKPINKTWCGYPTLVTTAKQHKLHCGDRVQTSQLKKATNSTAARKKEEWGIISDKRFTKNANPTIREAANKIEVRWDNGNGEPYESNANIMCIQRKGRRRMAQREFSNRRDSPVMVRLLEEIIAAQDN